MVDEKQAALSFPTISRAAASDERIWDEYVHRHPSATRAHRWGWKRVIENSFGWPTCYLVAKADGLVTGILPLVSQKSHLFGNFMTSVPFLSAGGTLADNPVIEKALVAKAVEIAQELGATHVEFRYRGGCSIELPAKTNKLTVLRRVESDTQKMWAALDKKVRTDIKKAIKCGLTAEVCGPEATDEFYHVFATNMRDLGTPVYSRRFFVEMMREFPAECHICAVRLQEELIAATFLLGYRGVIEAGWSSSLRKYLPLKPNMLLYWKNLCYAGEKGYEWFDFGRSTRDSGTHNFKMQWGCEEIPLYWSYWVRDCGRLPELNPGSSKYRLAVSLWRHLPIRIANVLGPRIARCIP